AWQPIPTFANGWPRAPAKSCARAFPSRPESTGSPPRSASRSCKGHARRSNDMRVLLHTPLKPPDSPTPSGDREMARGLARLLNRLGHRVTMPGLSRVAPGVPLPASHLAGERRARAQAARLVAHWRALPAGHPERFDLWFTYHCYYRKPDWLGPIVTRAL